MGAKIEKDYDSDEGVDVYTLKFGKPVEITDPDDWYDNHGSSAVEKEVADAVWKEIKHYNPNSFEVDITDWPSYDEEGPLPNKADYTAEIKINWGEPADFKMESLQDSVLDSFGNIADIVPLKK